MKYCLLCKEEKPCVGLTVCSGCRQYTTARPKEGVKNRCVVSGCYSVLFSEASCVCKNHDYKWRKSGAGFLGWASAQN